MNESPETLQAVGNAWRVPVEKLVIKQFAKDEPQRALAIMHCKEAKLVTHLLGLGESPYTPRTATWVVKHWQDWQALQPSQVVASIAMAKTKTTQEKGEKT